MADFVVDHQGFIHPGSVVSSLEVGHPEINFIPHLISYFIIDGLSGMSTALATDISIQNPWLDYGTTNKHCKVTRRHLPSVQSHLFLDFEQEIAKGTFVGLGSKHLNLQGKTMLARDIPRISHQGIVVPCKLRQFWIIPALFTITEVEVVAR